MTCTRGDAATGWKECDSHDVVTGPATPWHCGQRQALLPPAGVNDGALFFKMLLTKPDRAASTTAGPAAIWTGPGLEEEEGAGAEGMDCLTPRSTCSNWHVLPFLQFPRMNAAQAAPELRDRDGLLSRAPWGLVLYHSSRLTLSSGISLR